MRVGETDPTTSVAREGIGCLNSHISTVDLRQTVSLKMVVYNRRLAVSINKGRRTKGGVFAVAERSEETTVLVLFERFKRNKILLA